MAVDGRHADRRGEPHRLAHAAVVARTPAQRWGAIEDFAGIAVFLSSPASNFINGAAITVDGGYSIQG